MSTQTAQEYFQPSSDQALRDKAALIVALVQGRESAARADYAHPRLAAIMKLLQEVGPSAARRQ